MKIEVSANKKINIKRLSNKVGGELRVIATPGTLTEVGPDGQELPPRSHGYVLEVPDELVEKFNAEIVKHKADDDDDEESRIKHLRQGVLSGFSEQMIDALKSDKFLRKLIRVIVRQNDDD